MEEEGRSKAYVGGSSPSRVTSSLAKRCGWTHLSMEAAHEVTMIGTDHVRLSDREPVGLMREDMLAYMKCIG